ncbi:MAG TPA: DinB family protein [Acidimicrobiales bacterium]|nr:DinB family protein [Acidimicrobiales bacterium]
MTDAGDFGRREPPAQADEQATLVGYLDYQRATFAWKCGGLDATALSATVAPSTMTLGGLLKHLALVEDWWFSCWLDDVDLAGPWAEVDFDADPDWEWHSAAHDAPEHLYETWRDAVARSRANLERVLADRGLGGVARRSGRDGLAPSVRWIVLHMIEEYARHNGHADLLRESIDGQIGE